MLPLSHTIQVVLKIGQLLSDPFSDVVEDHTLEGSDFDVGQRLIPGLIPTQL